MLNRTEVSIDNTVTRNGAPWLILATVALLVGKYTILPALPWWLVFLPIYVVPAIIIAVLLAVLTGWLTWQLLKGLWKLGVFLKNQCIRGCN